ncbi:MAG: R3H domain-containing nucleic acid-binding protein, partial [Candidatus Eisenbacteria bacterium]
SAIGSGNTLEEAVLEALNTLGARPNQVTLKKLEEGGPAGLMGGAVRQFRVRATWRPEFAPPPPPPPPPRAERPAYSEDEEIDHGPARQDRPDRGARGGRPERSERRERPARGDRPERPRRAYAPRDPGERFDVDEAFLAKVRSEAEWLIERLGFEARIAVAHEEDEITVSLTSDADDALLTGRRGDTRLSIQHVLSRLVNPRRGPGAHLLVDVNGYWAERKGSLLDRARALAAEAIASGDEATTEPLSPEERRVVHRALTADGSVTTESFGDGVLKRITIRPALKG